MNRLRIKIVGESGAGLLSTGEMLTSAMKNLGLNLNADREYPSLIKGGYSCYTLNLSNKPVLSLSKEADVMLALDKQGLTARFQELKNGGVLVHGYEKLQGIRKVTDALKKRGVAIINLPSRDVAEKNGGNILMTNVVLLGTLWKVLGLPYREIERVVKEKFKNKPALLAIDLKCLQDGYESVSVLLDLKKNFGVNVKSLHISSKTSPRINAMFAHKQIVVNGNQALALGAIHCGCRAYFAYPMSPSSTILSYMADYSLKTSMIVKQAEDEITVVQLALGAMFAGTRALCATSGGGFDLMSESISLAGIIENPLVIILAQRPGPGTGLPTWTAQADLNLAIYAGHGEFARVVLAVSDPNDCFTLIQEALNHAEIYQCPVIVLTEKVVAESLWNLPKFKQKTVPIKRGLVTGAALKSLKSNDRYKITPSGVSKRWLPASSPAYYFANSDEHLEDGALSEDAAPCREMIAKRVRKLETIRKNLPEPRVYGPAKGADISFVGWGSSKNTVIDAIELMKEKGEKVNYLHFSYLWPLKIAKLSAFFAENRNVHILEGNLTGQLAGLLEKEGFNFKGKLLKADGRPFFLEDVLDYIKKSL